MCKTDKSGKSNTIEIIKYKILQTGNYNEATCLIRNNSKLRYAIYSLLSSYFKGIDYFQQHNMVSWLLSNSKLRQLGFKVEDIF